MNESERNAMMVQLYREKEGNRAGWRTPVKARLLLQLEGQDPVDVCSAEVCADPARLALLVDVALSVEMNRLPLKVGPANGSVQAGRE